MEIFKSSIFKERFVGTLGADPNGERERERKREREREKKKKKRKKRREWSLTICFYVLLYLLLCLATHTWMELNWSGWVAKIATWGVLHLPILMLLGH